MRKGTNEPMKPSSGIAPHSACKVSFQHCAWFPHRHIYLQTFKLHKKLSRAEFIPHHELQSFVASARYRKYLCRWSTVSASFNLSPAFNSSIAPLDKGALKKLWDWPIRLSKSNCKPIMILHTTHGSRSHGIQQSRRRATVNAIHEPACRSHQR